MNYKKELKKMIDHRKKYIPVLKRMMDIYEEKIQENRNITDDPDLLLILELIDLEYLDVNAFLIDKRFGNIENIYYKGRFPFTDFGYKLLTGKNKK